MKINYTILLSFILLTFFSCKSKKIQNSNHTVAEETAATSFYWEQIDKTLDTDQFVSHNAYTCYKLDEKLFRSELNLGVVNIPDTDGVINTFEVNTNETMSQDLAERYPELLTYSGVQQNNKLCQVRITTKENKIDITVLCNDKTYYIKHFENENQSIYVLYDKQSLKHTRDIHD